MNGNLMTFDLISEEWNSLTKERKIIAVREISKLLINDLNRDEDFISEILTVGREFENDDYFGTEGADI